MLSDAGMLSKQDRLHAQRLRHLRIPPGYRLATLCDPDPAIAIARANQDHRLDGYVREALILILILAIASSHEHMFIGLADDHGRYIRTSTGYLSKSGWPGTYWYPDLAK